MGQVVSTSVGLRQISGVGGQIDFVRGANMSKGGRAIMAMPSTTGKGKVSKIVPFLDPGSAVTTTRNDVNYVITEYGIAQLRGKPLGQRLLLPSSMLRYHQNVFLDDVTVEQVEQALGVPLTFVEQDGFALLDAMLGVDSTQRPEGDWAEPEETEYFQYNPSRQ